MRPLDHFTLQIDALCQAAIARRDGDPTRLSLALEHHLEIAERQLGWYKATEDEILDMGCWEDGSSRVVYYFDMLGAMLKAAAQPEILQALTLAMYRGRWLLDRWFKYNSDAPECE